MSRGMRQFSAPNATQSSESQLVSAVSSSLLFVILNFNGIDDTLACLESLSRQSCRDFAVQVIDNGSLDDDLNQITERFPGVEIKALPDNLGWAGGNNVGMQQALDRGFRFVCLLNNDTVLESTVVKELLAAAHVLGPLCILHPAIADYDDPTTWQLYPPVMSRAESPVSDVLVAHDLVEMDHVYGACLMLPIPVIARVGLLDERFFLQLEETDYFQRAKRHGVRSFCARRARILHKESMSFGGRITPSKTYYQVRNSFLLAEKHIRTPYAFLHAVRTLLYALHGQALSSGARLTGWRGFVPWLVSGDPLARAARQGAWDYLRRRFGRRSESQPASKAAQ